jgi:hypothetical protein
MEETKLRQSIFKKLYRKESERTLFQAIKLDAMDIHNSVNSKSVQKKTNALFPPSE